VGLGYLVMGCVWLGYRILARHHVLYYDMKKTDLICLDFIETYIPYAFIDQKRQKVYTMNA
jgi:hypothetical protein